MLVRRGRLLPVLVFRGQMSCVTTAVDSTHPLLGPGSPEHHPAPSRARYLVPIHHFELGFHLRICLLSVRKGCSAILHRTLERDSDEVIIYSGRGQREPRAARSGESPMVGEDGRRSRAPSAFENR